MNSSGHTIHELFAQLGLPNEEEDVQSFIASNGPLPDGLALADAPFWTEAQARFLREEILKDADWAELVDQLNLAFYE